MLPLHGTSDILSFRFLGFKDVSLLWLMKFVRRWYLTTIQAQPRLLSISKHFPQRHAKHPRVRGMRKSACLQALWGTPWQITRKQNQSTQRVEIQNNTDKHHAEKKWVYTKQSWAPACRYKINKIIWQIGFFIKTNSRPLTGTVTKLWPSKILISVRVGNV